METAASSLEVPSSSNQGGRLGTPPVKKRMTTGNYLALRRLLLRYSPEPIDTTNVHLDEEILALTERLAKNAHEVWALRRMCEGWRFGPRRDDAQKEHPCLVPYEQLPESEKQYDRDAAMQTLKTIAALGYELARNGTSKEP